MTVKCEDLIIGTELMGLRTRILRCGFLCGALASASIVVAAQSNGFPATAAQELANVKQGLTVMAWMREHPTDTTVSYSYSYWDSGNWIVRATHKVHLPDGGEILRRAYFYVPDPPADMTLPRNTSAQQILSSAQLGFIWIQTNESNREAGEELADKTREELSSRLAKGQYDLKISFANAAYWSKTAEWKLGHAIFVSAYDSVDAGPKHPYVLAFGFLPVSGLHVDFAPGDDLYGEAFSADMRSLDEAIAASGLTGKELKPILLVRQRIEEYHSGRWHEWKTRVSKEVVRALVEWLSVPRRQGGRQYAAALLAADIALDLSQQFVNPENEAIRKELKAIGANYTYAQLDGYVYTHGWLKKALRLDRGGPIGDLILISVMEKGFAPLFWDMDNVYYDGSRRVIFEGERFLSRSRNIKLRTRVHLLVAWAYSDIVALADEADEGYSDAASYRASANWARHMAITHYRRVLKQQENPRTAVRIWKATWRLLAGVPPADTHFFHAND
jgi:hypothetical protein